MTENAFARAAATSGATTVAPTDQLTGNTEGYDPLFGGGPSRPSLFIEAHPSGTEFTGTITEAPFDKHSRFFKRGGIGELKYWGDDNKPTADATDARGNARRPVNDTVVPLSTDQRDRSSDRFQDDGTRAWYLKSKSAMEAFKKAIVEAGVTSRPQLVGMTLTVKRYGSEDNWQFDAKLSR